MRIAPPYVSEQSWLGRKICPPCSNGVPAGRAERTSNLTGLRRCGRQGPASAGAHQRCSTAAPSSRRHYGLGLALVADVAASHDGSVSATNRPGGSSSGAVLTLTLPVLPGSSRQSDP